MVALVLGIVIRRDLNRIGSQFTVAVLFNPYGTFFGLWFDRFIFSRMSKHRFCTDFWGDFDTGLIDLSI